MGTSGVTTYYYLNAEQQPVGPMDLNAIRKLADAGIVNSEVLICPAGEEEWKPLKGYSGSAPEAAGPPLTPPPRRSSRVTSTGHLSTLWASSSDWLAPAAVGIGILSVLTTSLPVLAFLLAIPALLVGISILRRPAAPKRGLALAAVATGSLGALPALLFIVGAFFGMLTPGSSSSLFGSSIEDQVIGAWVSGTEAQYVDALFGYRMRAEFNSDGTCTITQGMGVGAANPNDPRKTEFGIKASGHWELSKRGDAIVAKIGQDSEFKMQGNNGERSFTARGGPYESSEGAVETWEFEIRKQGDDIELFCYPPGFNRGYAFVRVR